MSSIAVASAALVAALTAATVIGWAINRRSGVLRQAEGAAHQDASGLGLSGTGPTVVHFSAAWCGPCAAVRRVVDQVCADLPDVAHVEIDIDASPVAARRMAVLSLPTTLIFDADGRQLYRTAGVPKVADLRSALQPLLT
ncbi:thiol reductase thioredoxin [Mycobacterium kansasii]|uniref:Thioredoxin n=1 Tax=Mycobacterium attenuatum TaxID=2341086 RepID=A0A498Q767_9MYCO|nr:thioredoxin family protein [Mycobacterium attenuatum]ORB83119.1 thiol reductase thioredoxin [Mycobacterium kansasii]VBA40563.1 Thioredoxin [Mycobacterium attenuatum]VBA56146.1 Thioredoxin [Mycobacterium attenuatum]VBA59788.1 Thioredoxin [Mycobacterium attenuatum]